MEDAWDAGLIVVAAAGNMGPRKEHHFSRQQPEDHQIGASDDEQIEAFPRKGRILTGYSGRGPTCACIVKPELTAPGTGIVSCSSRYAFTRQGYTVKSGTSMSTPVVSGAAALLLSLHPELSNLDVKMRMHESTIDLKLPGSRQSWGFLRIDRLLR
ncbi:MAG: S8 family serine peptidase [Blautia sp.]